MVTQRNVFPPFTPSTRPTVAVIGGGQLARMLHESASQLSINCRILAESATSSAVLANPQFLLAHPSQLEALDILCDTADVLTFEHEHIPDELFDHLAQRIPIHPARHALTYAQDKLVMRERLSQMGIHCPRWTRITGVDDIQRCGEILGYPFIVKVPRGGYDGHGVFIVRDAQEATKATRRAVNEDSAHEILGGGTSAKGANSAILVKWLESGHLLAEEMVPFYDELSIQVARRPSGEMRTWQVVRSEQADGVCSIVTAPAPDMSAKVAAAAADIAQSIAEELDVTGVMAVELFRVRHINNDGTHTDELIVNELAMRPHNSGHWSIEGARTSQFEQHLRAVLDLPLGDTSMTSGHVVMVNLLGSELEDPTHKLAEAMAVAPDAKIHLYGKDVQPGRKLGHITVCSDDAEYARNAAYDVMRVLAGRGPSSVPPAPVSVMTDYSSVLPARDLGKEQL